MTVTLERPPVAGSTAPAEVLGTGSISLPTGGTGNVTVVLTPAGQAAIATGAAIAVRVKGELAPTSTAVTAGKVDFGWQRRPGP